MPLKPTDSELDLIMMSKMDVGLMLLGRGGSYI